MSLDEFRSLIHARERSAEMRAFERAFGVIGGTEKRTFRASGEVRQAGTQVSGTNDGSIQVIGHASVFDQPSIEMASQFGIFTEYIDRNAFDNVLKRSPDVLLTWDHDTRWILGRTGNNTLDLTVDAVGLRYWSRIAPTSYAEDLRVLMEGGYLNQSSFLFRIAPGGEEWSIYEDAEGNETVTRRIFEIGELYDVCVCASGAYPQTDSGLMRSYAVAYASELGFLERKAIPFKETPKAPESDAWDAGKEVKSASIDDLMAMCAWYDPDKKDADGNLTKGAFKLPHHKQDGHAVVWAGVKAAMSRLNQSNTQIPDSDRQGVYNHLKKHYAQFNQEAPELRSRADIEAESRKITEELRALGDVVWGPEEGVNDLICDLECQINEHNDNEGPEMAYDGGFSVVDISVNMNKAIVCDWNDYSFWLVPFTMENDEPVAGDMSEWVQIDTAWVTTAEGYEANIRSAKIRREARMADETAVEAEVEAAAEVAEVEAAAEVEPEAEAEAAEVEGTPEVEAEAEAVEPEAESEVEADDAAARSAEKARLLAEARSRIASARAL